MRIAVAQINTTVGDFPGNLRKVRESLEEGRRQGVDLIVFPEQTLPGYPAEDLLEREDFLTSAEEAFQEAVRACQGIAMVLGTITRAPGAVGNPIYNSAALVDDGKVVGLQHKSLLPTYDVFDEGRYFRSAESQEVFLFRGRKLGLAICEDLWNDPEFWSRRRYGGDPFETLVHCGADLVLAVSASPFSLGRQRFRQQMARVAVKRHGVPLVYCNLVGGNTTLVFDGASFALDGAGSLRLLAPGFEEAFAVWDTEAPGEEVSSPDSAESVATDLIVEEESDAVTDEDVAAGFDALVLGVRDYMGKSGFRRAVLGLSGGIDSALTAVVAARAIGPENVIGVSLPSRYSSDGSLADARLLSERLGIEYKVIPIEKIFQASLETLAPTFAGYPEDVTEENLQARIRGMIVMALSNKFGAILLTTGNKSELAVGYCTLYGDMSGGLAVISDVPKTLVYRMARFVNGGGNGDGEVIPEETITKPPSAELRPDQKDEDSLPPYDVLDAILQAYIEQQAGLDAIVAQGFDADTVADVIRMVNRNEYKRKQAAPGLRITGKAFGPGRRLPLVEKFRRGR